MKSLKTIESFGSTDADKDHILNEVFEEHSSFVEVQNQNRFLVIGKKGSGKTAIFKKMLSLRENHIFTYGHTFSDYPWHYHEKQKVIGVPEQDRYLHSWKYLILMSLSKIILNNDASIPFNDNSLEQSLKIEKFVVDTYGSRDVDITQIFTPSKTLKLNPQFGINWGIFKGEIKPGLLPVEFLPKVIQDVNKTMLDLVVQSLNPSNNYYILFDELDLGFDPSSEEYKQRIIGLILAARSINNYAREKNIKLSIVVFLRNDIYNILHFEDKNKITRNDTTHIEWDTDRTSHTLKKIMENRFTELLKESDTEKVLWENVFDESKQMTGRQSKYQHIIDKTFLRPRDIIQFSNEVLNEFRKRETNDNIFSNEDINKSKVQYSRYFLDELDDEIHKHLEEYNKYFDIFRSIGVLQFDKAEFVITFERKGKDLENFNPEDVLKNLFEYSVIGYYRAGGSGYGGSEYIFKYKNELATFDISADKFKIHPGLMEHLQLKKYTKTMSVE